MLGPQKKGGLIRFNLGNWIKSKKLEKVNKNLDIK